MNDFVHWDTSWGGILNPQRSELPISRSEYLLTYRSGGRYDAEINKGATQLLGAPFSDNAARQLGDYGHEMEHHKERYFTTKPRIQISDGSTHYTGPVFFTGEPWGAPQAPAVSTLGPSLSSLNVLGAGAIASTYPTKPQADLLVGIAELLREGLPTQLFSAITGMRGNSKRQLIENLSGDYLNYIFGITPLVREVDKLVKALSQIEALRAQLVRDSGRVVRRDRELVNETKLVYRQETVMRPDVTLPQGVVTLPASEPRTNYLPAVYSQTQHDRVWFRAGFQYWIPDLTDAGTDFQSLNISKVKTSQDLSYQILGLHASPKAAWNLLPFSWLVDWFVNVGVLFENADAMTRYGLVMKYGYLMCESKFITSTTLDFGRSNQKLLGSVSSSRVSTRQRRIRATPYGFGLKDVDINPIQWSILASLAVQAQKR